jgi:hypothetical protein
LSNAIVQGTVSVPDDNAVVQVDGRLNSATLKPTGNGVQIQAIGTQTWTGTTISFESPTVDARVLIKNTSPDDPATLTLTGQVNGARGIIADHPDNTAPATLINQGTISSTVAGREISVQPGVFTNIGTVLANGGSTLRIVPIPTNYSADTQTLTGGNWNVTGNSTLALPKSVIVTTNKASIALTDPAAMLANAVGLTRNDGTLTLANQANYNSLSPFTNNGTLAFNTGCVAHFLGAIGGTGSVTVDTNSVMSATSLRQNALTVRGSLSLAASSGPSVLQTLTMTATG